MLAFEEKQTKKQKHLIHITGPAVAVHTFLECISKWGDASIIIQSQVYTACSSRISPAQASPQASLQNETCISFSDCIFESVRLHWNKSSCYYLRPFPKTVPCKCLHIENLEMYFAMSIVLFVFGLLSLAPFPRAAGQLFLLCSVYLGIFWRFSIGFLI